jgi:hypothetical protein
MPTLSASDYTTYLKFKAAAASPIQPAIQTRDNATLSRSVLNANILTSQAAYVTTPATTVPVIQSAVVTGATSTPVTAARTDVLSAASANGSVITYTSSQAHGLSNGTSVTISGFTGTLSPTPNRTGVVTVVNPTSFTIPAVGAPSGAATGTGSMTGRVYYTTGVANGLLAGDVISITGITTFTASGATVLAAPTATTFVLSSTTTGTAVSAQTGSITGLVYYTTGTDHGLSAGQQNVTISGLTTTPAFNLSLVTVYRAPSSVVIIVQNSATGTALSGQSGVLTITFFGNPTTSIAGLNYVRPMPPNNVNNPNALSTVGYAGTSGAMGSSATQRPGGLPTGFKGSQGSYTRLPQNAGWIQGNMVSSGPRRF